MKRLEGAHFFAGVEDDFLAADGENDDVIVELVEVQIAGCEDPRSRSTTFMA